MSTFIFMVALLLTIAGGVLLHPYVPAVELLFAAVVLIAAGVSYFFALLTWVFRD